MHMRMVLQALGPGVQDGQEAQFGSETFGISGHFHKSLGYGVEQNPIDDLRVPSGANSCGRVNTT